MVACPMILVAAAAFLFGYVLQLQTPSWYASNGHIEDAELLLKRVYNTSDVDQQLRDLMPQKTASPSPPLWTYWRSLVVGICVAAFQQFTGINAFMANSNTLFRDAGLSSKVATYASIGITAANVVCTLIPLFLLDRLGRKTLLVIGALGMTIATAPATICYWIEWNKEDSSSTGRVLAIAGALLFMVFFAVSIGPITWIYIVEIFPLEIKNRASSICVAVNWLSATIMVFLSGILPAKVAYTIFTIASALCLCFVLLCVRETKGRALGDSPYK